MCAHLGLSANAACLLDGGCAQLDGGDGGWGGDDDACELSGGQALGNCGA